MAKPRISDRRREILAAAASGLTTKEIAAKLGISEFTVSTTRRFLHREMQVHNMAGLTLAAIAHGVIEAPALIMRE